MSGAEPWMGSYSPEVGLNPGEDGMEGAPASDADGRRPRDPGMTLDSSDRLYHLTVSNLQSRQGGWYLHITEQIFGQDDTVQFSWVGYDQHSG